MVEAGQEEIVDNYQTRRLKGKLLGWLDIVISEEKELVAQLREINDGRRSTGEHRADCDTGSFGVISERLKSIRKRKRALSESLHLLSIGKYGCCVECEEPIPLRRLQIIPETNLCVDCAKANGH